MELTVYGSPELLEAAKSRILELEAALSVTDENSEIYAINHGEDVTLSESTLDLVEKGLDICRRTEGALDLSVYPVVRAWGFTASEYRVPAEEELKELLKHVDYTKIETDRANGTVEIGEHMEIDLGGVAKGYAADRVISMLEAEGVDSALLSLGGNIQTLGSKPDGSAWRVGVQDPLGSGYAGLLEAADKAVVTSGGYERYFVEDGETYWHIIDPASGKPARSGLISVTVVGESGLLCDGLSTALFVMGLEKAVAFWRESSDFEALFIDETGRLFVTAGLADSFAPLGDYEDAELTLISRD